MVRMTGEDSTLTEDALVGELDQMTSGAQVLIEADALSGLRSAFLGGEGLEASAQTDGWALRVLTDTVELDECSDEELVGSADLAELQRILAGTSGKRIGPETPARPHQRTITAR